MNTNFRAPTGPDLTGFIRKTEPWAIGTGAFTDVFKGEWRRPGGRPIVVAIKIFRGVHNDFRNLADITRRLERESRVWHGLRHINVQPYFGWCNSSEIGPSTALISPFCENGTIMEYISRNPNADRFNFVIGIAKGLHYLHCNHVIHGDLQGNNILIDNSGNACLTDFGRAKVIGHEGYSTTLVAGCVMYMAPELFQDEDQFEDETLPEPPFSIKSDVYAFAMLTFELLTGHLPLQRGNRRHFIHPGVLVRRIVDGERPNRAFDLYRYISDELWRLLEDCWAHHPERRPYMSAVLQVLGVSG